ncbi:Bifunctional acetohydroxyacid reductoisomerase [Dimargaris cristalligena]|uniref:ketol-acid reductoisomerase (NADP(+)) n=1 Tax=Dimargaris cristalligena TaxID=215637 RepID=A0A4P9ZWP0_9FUNG|nr:Bifunctional acetohydroxyacid reductoisomerase [Dimargaris cristalligena]RKP38086.1 ketol-acid reductoisomerase [Dimargaris cristalligena]|eukprot:RKP38086.1 ketol-acid reductoisomerase [Dimargaris cristalligena]
MSATRTIQTFAGRVATAAPTSRLGAARCYSVLARATRLSATPTANSWAAAATRFTSVPARTLKTLDFGGTKETVYERADYPKEKLQQIFGKDTMAVLGYGPQGRGQSLNMRDNGLKVIIGTRKDGRSWKKALEDGWTPGKDLFPIEEACQQGTVIMNLLSDAAQVHTWPTIKKHLTAGKTLYFSHGFGVVYRDQTNIVPPKDIDVILAAPKGSGFTVRRLFQDGKGINSSIAIFQDASGQAQERAAALGIAIGSGYLYETTFEREVSSDLVGERGILMGAIQGLFRAQYDVLRARGHTPSEAFNETVEEATQSLYPLIGEKGMDWMYSNCSTTAQRGALDWEKPFHDATKPVFEKLYEEVANGNEARRSIEKNSASNYREELEKELEAINQHEMWRTGKTVRSLRPENQ